MLEFSTKANTLQSLSGMITSADLLPLFFFSVAQLKEKPFEIVEEIQNAFAGPYSVRSSAICEDSTNASHAGEFQTLLNVQADNLLSAIHQVAASYTDDNNDNQVLIQPMLHNIIMSGVIFTCDPNTGGNYYIINYDESGSADSVTSGAHASVKTQVIFHNEHHIPQRFERICLLAQELIELFGRPNIDIEFAVCDGTLYLLQARPLVIKRPLFDYPAQMAELTRIESFINREMAPKPYLKGKRTIYGVMPDWNPAEMIGIRPKPLALSLYKRLITDKTWAYQRHNYGYRNLRSNPLMPDFCGLPYIDTRVSFNSFVPNDLPDELGEKLVDYYLEQLALHPQKHDKIEFDIVFSCYTFDIEHRLKVLNAHGFSSEELETLRSSLQHLTNRIINTQDGLWISDAKKIQTLMTRNNIVMNSDLDIVSKIYWLLEDCARYGTLPFAGLARAGFIAVLLLQSLVSIGILTSHDYHRYMNELDTVSSQMTKDQLLLSRREYLKKYGHLRPGTYDITSPRYDSAPELYFNFSSSEQGEAGYENEIHNASDSEKTSIPFSLTIAQYEQIHHEMESQGFTGDVLALFKFIKAGIEGREYAKFVFSRNVSDALELIAQLGERYGYSRDEMAYFDVAVIDQLIASTVDPQVSIRNSIDYGMQQHKKTLSLTLPPLITAPEDIWSFSIPDGQPNYVTLGNVTAEVCHTLTDRNALKGKIVAIMAADPGYDWIFGCEIKGLITAYGGINSHMAIRAGEMNLPAVIGVGEKLYEQWSYATILHIDCANRYVEVTKI